MTKENTINEAEATEAVHAFLTAKGIKVTKTLVNQVIDAQIDLAIAGLTAGKGIKLQGLATIEVREHQARNYTVPNPLVEDPANPGTFLPQTFTTVASSAGRHIGIETSPKLLDALNAEVVIAVPVG